MTAPPSRRSVLLGAGPALLGGPARAQDRGTVRAVMHAALGALDPFNRPTYINRNHGYLVYDTLFALDRQNRPRPQMVAAWEASPDGLTWRFTLRPGLMFHDGAPVRAADAAASLRRWMPRDVLGRRLLSVLDGLDAPDDATLRLVLRRPYAHVLETLAKPSAPVPVILPRHLVDVPDSALITDPTGSGPFRFNTAAHRPGDRVAYDRFHAYQPRPEPASGLAGGKQPRLDRVEWLEITDPETATNALLAGEAQVMENVPADALALARRRGVVLRPRSFGNSLFLRFNSAQRPFDDPATRRAVMAAVNQAEFLGAQLGDARLDGIPLSRPCSTVLSCDSPWAADIPGPAADLDRARALLRRGAYAGELAAILHPADLPALQTVAPLADHLLRSLGINTRLDATDWRSMLSRAARNAPVTEGGWSVVPGVLSNLDLISPLVNPYLDATGPRGYPGWADDPEMERLRDSFAFESDPERRAEAATLLQRRSDEQAFTIPLGGHRVVTGHRDGVRGVIADQVLVFWNMERG